MRKTLAEFVRAAGGIVVECDLDEMRFVG